MGTKHGGIECLADECFSNVTEYKKTIYASRAYINIQSWSLPVCLLQVLHLFLWNLTSLSTGGPSITSCLVDL